MFYIATTSVEHFFSFRGTLRGFSGKLEQVCNMRSPADSGFACTNGRHAGIPDLTDRNANCN